MLAVVQHTLTDPPAALARGERLKRSDGAPPGTRVLQFLPSRDGTLVTCLWESRALEDVQTYVDEILGPTSSNLCYSVEADAAFAELPRGIAGPPGANTA
ncbi:MAG TPA: hypothetical protein VFP22_07615 [Candidatus Limnocylindrales bacterium]|nr:hypothetical protein [Candidatus Limnocylindrales bacterium]